LLRQVVPVTAEFHGGRLAVCTNTGWQLTPLALVMAATGGADVLFAFDFLPATFAITTDPYLVFSANAFALPGLRALYTAVVTGWPESATSTQVWRSCSAWPE
jgi:tellurite resistance protein TerC